MYHGIVNRHRELLVKAKNKIMAAAVETNTSVPLTGDEQAAAAAPPANAPAPPVIEQAPAPQNITTTDLEQDAIEAESLDVSFLVVER